MSESPPPAPTTSSRYAISVLIVTAAILWNLAALTFASQKSFDWRSKEVAALLGLALAQTGLAAGYFAWGRLNVVLRAGILLAAVMSSTRISHAAVDEPGLSWFTMHFAIALATATTLLVGRLLGVRLSFGDESGSRHPTSYQFRIWDVMCWTAAVAAIADASRWLTFDQSINVRLLLLTCIEPVVICFCLVAPLGISRARDGIIVAFGAAIVFVAPFAFSAPDPSPLIKMTIAESAVIITSISLLRLGGYRLHGVSSVHSRVTTQPSSTGG